MSTPTSLELPDGVRPTMVRTSRGSFAALEAVPVSGVCEREPALLVPGYTGSKEDFLAVLGQLADHGRQVVAIDMRGQFQTPGASDPGGYAPPALAADIAAVIQATGAKHLLGHSYGGLVTREALLRTRSQEDIGSFTLMSSGPSALTGPRAEELRAMFTALGVALVASGADGSLPDRDTLAAGIAGIWRDYLEPQAVADGVPAPIVAFLARRMASNDPYGLVQMARHLLSAPDRTSELARLDRFGMLVIYGEDDSSWSPGAQEAMARRLGARRICIPGASHSPAVEAPATTAIALTKFWDAAEAAAAHAGSARMA
ncbi:MAG: alpha/beta fold hydrolase [Streptosporangiaceae bacterium]